ncbi:hypothetical protein [Helicobacter monodelphidis]|uniref:hypothetical protein n=1 Tax=Helicobacter sp. 15-1451 TaxID=2004995 RepID=UPI0011BDB339|nr:hypothetical protein [Helicobacter sp. 15-1451]
MGGISFKSIDPQYYEFKRLCEEVKNERTVHNENLYRIYQYFTNGYDYYLDDEKTQKTYYKSDFTTRERVQLQKISNKISEYKEWLYYEDMPLLSYKDYTYKYFGIFLGGDEGAGWHINPKYKALECKNIRY